MLLSHIHSSFTSSSMCSDCQVCCLMKRTTLYITGFLTVNLMEMLGISYLHKIIYTKAEG